MAQQGPLVASDIDISLPGQVPDGIRSPEVVAVYGALIRTAYNLLQNLERFTGISQKDPSLWGELTPNETLIRYMQARFYVKFSQTCAFGDFVNLHDVTGVCNARKAEATSGSVKAARGYCNVIGGVTNGNFGEVILSQGLLPISGLVSGQAIYLSAATPGLATVTPPTAAGQLEQFLGVGVATDLAYIDISLGQFIQH